MADFEPVSRLTKDLALASKTLSDDEARFLVDAYYLMQEQRIRTAAQVRALSESEEPHDVLRWLSAQSDSLESQVKRALTKYVEQRVEAATWAYAQTGIGPVITAGLFAHLDIHKAPTCGHFWNFAGLNPGVKWEKGCKRPWNASLKTLCWKIGESFVKVSGKEDAYYGQLYVQRKAQEMARNERDEFKEQAAAMLIAKNFGKDTKARKFYEKGLLPPAHVHARAKRWVVKIFLSHLHQVWFYEEYHKMPPEPYAIAHLGHAHLMKPPAWVPFDHSNHKPLSQNFR